MIRRRQRICKWIFAVEPWLVLCAASCRLELQLESNIILSIYNVHCENSKNLSSLEPRNRLQQLSYRSTQYFYVTDIKHITLQLSKLVRFRRTLSGAGLTLGKTCYIAVVTVFEGRRVNA